MKKSLFLIVALLGSFALQAQQAKGEHVIHAGVGNGLFGMLYAIDFDNDVSTNKSSTLAFSTGYDYGINRRFSVGATVGWQAVGQEFEDVTVEFQDEEYHIEYFKYDIKRTSVGVRGLVHFGRSDRVDMYTGMRAALNIYDVSANATEYDFLDVGQDINTFGYQFIPFGARFYFTDQIGAHVEVGFGAPHITTAGLTLKL